MTATSRSSGWTSCRSATSRASSSAPTTGAWASARSSSTLRRARGPSLHRHPYDEVLITQEGTATFFLGEDEQREVGPGEVVVVPAGQWHGFVNSGDGPLRQIDIHVSASFDTEWLETSCVA